jgi:hypothetical protein
LGANAASDAEFMVYLADGTGKDASLDDFDGLLGAIQIAGFTTGANGGIDICPRRFLLFALTRRTVSFSIENSALGADIKTGSAFLAENRIDVKTNLEFTFNGLFGALFGAGAASNAVFADTVGHGEQSPLSLSREGVL